MLLGRSVSFGGSEERLKGWSKGGQEEDVLILGSCPAPPFLRFCRRDVDEKGELVVCWRMDLCARHCCGRIAFDGILEEREKGRKTGLNVERFMFGCGCRRNGGLRWCWAMVVVVVLEISTVEPCNAKTWTSVDFC